MKKIIDSYFGITETKSSFKTEIIGGISAFISMSYIIFVNPMVLSATGMNQDAVFLATILSAAFATLIMGIYAKFPLGLAPCMSMNAYFTYGIVFGMGYTWEEALACVLVSSVLFLILSVTSYRTKLVNAIPQSLKNSASIGLGLFIAFIGLKNAAIIIPDENTFITFGSLTNINTLIATFGILVLVILMVKKNKYAVLFSMLVSMTFGLIINLLSQLGILELSTTTISQLPTLPDSYFVNPLSLFDTMFTETLFVAIKTIPEILTLSGLSVIMTLVFLDFMSTSATLSAAKSQVNSFDLETENDKIYISDAAGTFFGSILGTSNVTSYVESVSGVANGAKTGFVAVVIAICFLLSIFLYPLLSLVTPAVTTPALVAIGIIMFMNITTIDWHNSQEESIPAFFTIILMPLTGSIALALCIGFVLYTLLMIVANRITDINKYMYVLSFISFIYLIGELI